MDSANNAIGIFDSGVGGLTVFRRIAERLPDEPITYLGDTARVPYGTKSAETVIRYARACSIVLLERGIKVLVVACNTASAFALDTLRNELPIPVLGVVEPGVRRAVQETRNNHIGVIGTPGTISSGAYQNAIRTLAPEAHVFCKPCPLFVPLAEEGWTDGEVPREAAREYLTELLNHNIDVLVLGCTHYPVLKKVIAETAGPEVALVDSAEAMSGAVADTLARAGLQNRSGRASAYTFLVTDAPDGFAEIGKRFSGHEIDHVEWVDL
jgi:glutamate racemase